MGIILRWKNFNYMLEIDILRNESHKYECPEGVFWVSKRVLGVQKTTRRPAGY